MKKKTDKMDGLLSPREKHIAKIVATGVTFAVIAIATFIAFSFSLFDSNDLHTRGSSASKINTTSSSRSSSNANKASTMHWTMYFLSFQ